MKDIGKLVDGMKLVAQQLGTVGENLRVAIDLIEGMAATVGDSLQKPGEHPVEFIANDRSKYTFVLRQWLPQLASIEVMAKDLEEATTRAILIAQGKIETGWQWRSAYDHEDEARDFVLWRVIVPGHPAAIELNTPVFDKDEGAPNEQ